MEAWFGCPRAASKPLSIRNNPGGVRIIIIIHFFHAATQTRAATTHHAIMMHGPCVLEWTEASDGVPIPKSGSSGLQALISKTNTPHTFHSMPQASFDRRERPQSEHQQASLSSSSSSPSSVDRSTHPTHPPIMSNGGGGDGVQAVEERVAGLNVDGNGSQETGACVSVKGKRAQTFFLFVW
jgi:hypothetical protein